MGELAERLDRMRVQSTGPRGGRIELTGAADLRITFAPGFYQRCTPEELGDEVAALLENLWAARTREYYAVLGDVSGQPSCYEPKPISPKDVEYVQRRAQVISEGSSADGRVRLTLRGVTTWGVRLAEDTLYTLPEEAFAARVAEAATALVGHLRRNMRLLNLVIYGEGQRTS